MVTFDTKADLVPLATKAGFDSRLSALEARLTWRIVSRSGRTRPCSGRSRRWSDSSRSRRAAGRRVRGVEPPP